ncbi:hypothetical protein MMC07_003990 [Pseudocyphellaria aurata]|nr:hypothetical protein [Pseudocyphellaria aurata]
MPPQRRSQNSNPFGIDVAAVVADASRPHKRKKTNKDFRTDHQRKRKKSQKSGKKRRNASPPAPPTKRTAQDSPGKPLPKRQSVPRFTFDPLPLDLRPGSRLGVPQEEATQMAAEKPPRKAKGDKKKDRPAPEAKKPGPSKSDPKGKQKETAKAPKTPKAKKGTKETQDPAAPPPEPADATTPRTKRHLNNYGDGRTVLRAEKDQQKQQEQQLFRVVMSNLPTIKRNVFYGDDFVQKGFVKTSRQHRDPPALMVDGSKFRYAVVCNDYQLHGAEGVKANLDHKKGSKMEKSVTAPPTGGDRRVPGFGKGGAGKTPGTKGAVKVEIPLPKSPGGLGKTAARQMMEEADLPVDDDEEEESPSDGPPADPRYEGLRQYGKAMDQLYGASLQFTKEVSDATVKSGYKPNKRED